MQNKEHKKTILHLICGLPGSGKTALSKKLAATTGAIRFCPDEWIKDIWPRETSETIGNEHRDQIEQLQWKIGREVLRAGTDIIIEWGTWGRDERIKLRDEAWEVDAEVTFYYLDVPLETLRERISARNKSLGPHEFLIPDDQLEALLDEWANAMQAPQADELATYDYLG